MVRDGMCILKESYFLELDQSVRHNIVLSGLVHSYSIRTRNFFRFEPLVIKYVLLNLSLNIENKWRSMFLNFTLCQ